MQSTPSKARTAIALVFVLLAGLGVLAWEAMHESISEFGAVSVWFIGVMPNFLSAAFMPLLIFATRIVLVFRDYLGIVVTICAALCAYEFAQIWLPKRTFDWADIGASLVGSCLACLVGWLVFFRCLTRRAESSQSIQRLTR